MHMTSGFVLRARETTAWFDNDGHVNWLALYCGKVSPFRSLNTRPLDQVVHPSEYFHNTILLYPMQYYNKTKRMFEPCMYMFLLLTFSMHECPL